jgi:hypothetical protein
MISFLFHELVHVMSFTNICIPFSISSSIERNDFLIASSILPSAVITVVNFHLGLPMSPY